MSPLFSSIISKTSIRELSSISTPLILILSLYLRICGDVKKTLASAIANAENNYQYDIDKLVIKEAYCGKQVIMKRFRPRAKGRAAPIIKPYSNLTIILSEQKQNQKEKHGTKG